MTDSQLEAWNEIVAAAKATPPTTGWPCERHAQHRLRAHHPAPQSWCAAEAILAVDEVVQRIRQIEEAPGLSMRSWTIC